MRNGQPANKGQAERNVILTRKLAYHGVSLGALQATGIPPLREHFGPLPDGFVHLDAPYPFRGTTTDVGWLTAYISGG